MLEPVNLDYVRQMFQNKDNEIWKNNLEKYPKLRTYTKYKHEYKLEPYVFKIYDRSHRSIMAHFRSGMLPLSLETGRYTNIPEHFRICLFCNSNSIENEVHFIFECSLYDQLRQTMLNDVMTKIPDFLLQSIDEKLSILISENYVKQTSSFLYSAFMKRRSILYNSS